MRLIYREIKNSNGSNIFFIFLLFLFYNEETAVNVEKDARKCGERCPKRGNYCIFSTIIVFCRRGDFMPNFSDQWEKRGYDVVKANAIIQQVSFDLTAGEQELVLFLISKIKPGDTELHDVEITFEEFSSLCGVVGKGGSYKRQIEKYLEGLFQKTCWVRVKGYEVLFTWIENPVVTDNNTVVVRLSNLLKPYLLDLREQFTQYRLMYALPLRSKYSIRLYELLKSWEGYEMPITITLEKLRQMFMLEDLYLDWRDFRKYVLEIPKNEINASTDILFDYESLRRGRKTYAVKFTIQHKSDLAETFDHIREELDHEENNF